MKKLFYFITLTIILISCNKEAKASNESSLLEIEDYRITALKKEQSEINLMINKIISLNKEPEKTNLIAELNGKYPNLFRNMPLDKLGKDSLNRLLQGVNKNYNEQIKLLSLKIEKENLQEKKQQIIDKVN